MSSIIRNNNTEKHPCSIADIENEIKIAEEKQERSTVIKLKRQLKKFPETFLCVICQDVGAAGQ